MRSILLHSGLAALAAFSLIGIGRIEPWSLLYRPRRFGQSRGRKKAGPLVGFRVFLLFHSRPWIGRERLIYTLGLRAEGRKKVEGGLSVGKMAATAAGVGRLEEEALRRKERLKALREKTGRKDKEDGEPNTKQLREGEEEGEKHRELRLRNYVPEDEDLKKRRVPQAKPVAVEEKVKEQLEAAKPEPVIEEVDLANLAPRKPDWDLKRDVAKKLEKLEKRTQRAIAELIRERLKGQEENLASAVATTAATEPEACDSD